MANVIGCNPTSSSPRFHSAFPMLIGHNTMLFRPEKKKVLRHIGGGIITGVEEDPKPATWLQNHNREAATYPSTLQQVFQQNLHASDGAPSLADRVSQQPGAVLSCVEVTPWI